MNAAIGPKASSGRNPDEHKDEYYSRTEISIWLNPSTAIRIKTTECVNPVLGLDSSCEMNLD